MSVGSGRPVGRPRHKARSQGSNQYRRVELDDFLDAQRERVARVLEQHAEQLRRRLRAYVAAELADADDDSGA